MQRSSSIVWFAHVFEATADACITSELSRMSEAPDALVRFCSDTNVVCRCRHKSHLDLLPLLENYGGYWRVVLLLKWCGSSIRYCFVCSGYIVQWRCILLVLDWLFWFHLLFRFNLWGLLCSE